MSINTTDRPIDLEQLGAELATAAGLAEPPELSAAHDGETGQTVIRCSHKAVTQTLLDDVVDAHVPAPPPPTDAEQVAYLKAELARVRAANDELTDIVYEELLS